jgi:hypothetical protein
MYHMKIMLKTIETGTEMLSRVRKMPTALVIWGFSKRWGARNKT